MADIFMSYKRGDDAARVEAIVGGLRANGYSVWWDKDIPAQAPWEDTIRAELQAAKLVIVCWSKEAIDSENVRSEARYAKERDKLIQLFVAPCEPPLFFGEHQGLLIYDTEDVFGPGFEAVLNAVRTRAGAAGEDAPAKADSAVRAWRRNEPAASWEPLQFGFAMSIAATLPLIVLFALMAVGAGASESEPVSYVVNGTRLAAIAGLIAFASGWLTYLLIARRPRRLGFLMATVLAGAAGVVAGALVLFLDAVWRAMPMDLGPMLPGMDNTERPLIGMYAVAAAIAGFAGARVFIPFFIAILRPILRSRWARGLCIVFALATPLTAVALGATSAPLGTAVVQRDEDIDLLIRQKGLAATEDVGQRESDPRYPNSMFSRNTIQRIQAQLALPADGNRNAALQLALIALPDKSEWTLAADGSGDARTMQELLARSWGRINVTLRSGIYEPEAAPDANVAADPGEDYFTSHGPLGLVLRAQAHRGERWNDGARRGAEMAHVVTLTSERSADVTFVENGAITLPAGFVLRDVKLRLSYVRQPFRVTSGASMENVQITLMAHPYAGEYRPFLEVLPNPASNTDAGGRPLPPGLEAQAVALIRSVTIEGETPLSGGILVSRGASAAIVQSRVGALQGRANFCVDVASNDQVVVRDNDFRQCATELGAIRVPATGSYSIANNLGARAIPELRTDPRGINDYRAY